MLQCAHCKHTIVYADHLVYRDAGDFIIDCNHCAAQNILAQLIVDKVELPIPTLAVVGYRD